MKREENLLGPSPFLRKKSKKERKTILEMKKKGKYLMKGRLTLFIKLYKEEEKKKKMKQQTYSNRLVQVYGVETVYIYIYLWKERY